MWHFKIYGPNTFPTTIYLCPKPPTPHLFDEKALNTYNSTPIPNSCELSRNTLRENFIIRRVFNNKIKAETSPSTHCTLQYQKIRYLLHHFFYTQSHQLLFLWSLNSESLHPPRKRICQTPP